MTIKPVMGKRDEDKIENKPIDNTDNESPNIMGSVDIIMKIWDDYTNRTHRIRNAIPYIKGKIPDTKNWTAYHIRTLRSVGNRLKEHGAYEQAMHEDWTYTKILEFFRKQKQPVIKIVPREDDIKSGELTADEYIKQRDKTLYR